MENENKEMDRQDPANGPRTPRGPRLNIWFLIILLVFIGLLVSSYFNSRVSQIQNLQFFEDQVIAKNVLELEIGEKEAVGRFKEPPKAPPRYNDAGELETPKDFRGEPVVLKEYFRVMIPTTPESRERLFGLLKEHHVQYSI